MIIKIAYGSRPGEKKIGEGRFICPFCRRKRKYEKFILKKKLWIFTEALSPFSLGDIGEFVLCMSCLRPLSPIVLDEAYQLSADFIDEQPDTTKIFNKWNEIYSTLGCEELLLGNTSLVEAVSPYIRTVAHNMRNAGVQLRLSEFGEARKYFVANINAGLQWQDINLKQDLHLQKTIPLSHKKMMEHMEAAHFILSLLP